MLYNQQIKMEQSRIQKIKSMMQTEWWWIFMEIIWKKIVDIESFVFSMPKNDRTYTLTDIHIAQRQTFKEIIELPSQLIDENKIIDDMNKWVEKMVEELSQ